MQIDADGYSFELPDNWDGIVGASRTRSGVTLRLLWEDSRTHSGILATFKAVKRPAAVKGDNERIGILTYPSGESRTLVAVYGREGACSEDNADLYWRLFDRLYFVYKSIMPMDGYSWQMF